MAVISSFGSRPEAEMAAAMLEGYDVPATVVGDDAGGAAGLNLAAGGYRLSVPDDLQAQAEALLEPVDDEREVRRHKGQPRPRWALQLVAVLVLAFIVLAVLSSLPE